VTRSPASSRRYITRRALCLVQTSTSPLYIFSLTAQEILEIADISRVARDQAGDLIGYQRPEVRQHIQEIVDYLDGDEVVFPNPIILALAPSTQFTGSRGPKVSDGFACSGTIEIPLHEWTRRRAAQVLHSIDEALREGFLPAAPRKDGCKGCDYLPVCGPYEEERVHGKSQPELRAPRELRLWK